MKGIIFDFNGTMFQDSHLHEEAWVHMVNKYSKGSLSEEDITKGNIVMGTGTIDTLGNVGEIGGVRYKLIGAVKKKAKVFLVPVENYEEAVAVKNEKNYDIQIIAVKTLKEALEALEKL